LHELLQLGSLSLDRNATIVCYAEDVHAIFIRTCSSIYMVDLKTMQHKNIGFEKDDRAEDYPFTSYLF
jgi:hypothetical protein